mmetsp:Transcript_72611/g.200329  ORF Transcript_72611/g.200329 Transcript_72611/m.200329 type:complete len:282 (-) Transcript_72611:43-888(-)
MAFKWAITASNGIIEEDGAVWDTVSPGSNSSSNGCWPGVVGDCIIRTGEKAKWTLRIERGTYHLVGIATDSWGGSPWQWCTRGMPYDPWGTVCDPSACPFAMAYSNHANWHQGAGVNDIGSRWNGSPQTVTVELDTERRVFAFYAEGRRCSVSYPNTAAWQEVRPAFAAQGGYGGSRVRIMDFEVLNPMALALSVIPPTANERSLSISTMAGREVYSLSVGAEQELPSCFWVVLAEQAGVCEGQLRLVLPNGQVVTLKTTLKAHDIWPQLQSMHVKWAIDT